MIVKFNNGVVTLLDEPNYIDYTDELTIIDEDGYIRTEIPLKVLDRFLSWFFNDRLDNIKYSYIEHCYIGSDYSSVYVRKRGFIPYREHEGLERHDEKIPVEIFFDSKVNLEQYIKERSERLRAEKEAERQRVIEKQKEQQQIESARLAEKRDKREYERLKQKYEGNSNDNTI